MTNLSKKRDSNPGAKQSKNIGTGDSIFAKLLTQTSKKWPNSANIVELRPNDLKCQLLMDDDTFIPEMVI